MREKLLQMNDKELDLFILNRLLSDNLTEDEIREGRLNHRRFDMSGYGEDNSCQIHNTAILNLFRDCGIYDHVTFLYLDAYKGTITIYYQWWNENKFEEEEYGGLGTREIITDILKRFYINSTQRSVRRMEY
jgi:hypothetical protein